MTTSPTTPKQAVSYIYHGISHLWPHEGFSTCKSCLRREKAQGGNKGCSAFSSLTAQPRSPAAARLSLKRMLWFSCLK